MAPRGFWFSFVPPFELPGGRSCDLHLVSKFFHAVELCLDGVSCRLAGAEPCGYPAEKDVKVLKVLSDVLEKLVRLEKMIGSDRPSAEIGEDIDEFRRKIAIRIEKVLASR